MVSKYNLENLSWLQMIYLYGALKLQHGDSPELYTPTWEVYTNKIKNLMNLFPEEIQY